MVTYEELFLFFDVLLGVINLLLLIFLQNKKKQPPSPRQVRRLLHRIHERLTAYRQRSFYLYYKLRTRNVKRLCSLCVWNGKRSGLENQCFQARFWRGRRDSNYESSFYRLKLCEIPYENQCVLFIAYNGVQSNAKPLGEKIGENSGAKYRGGAMVCVPCFAALFPAPPRPL